MAAFDHRRADASLRAHAIRFQAALRKQDEDALAELVLPKPPAWMLDPHATKRAAVGRIKKGNYPLPHQVLRSRLEGGRTDYRPPRLAHRPERRGSMALLIERGAPVDARNRDAVTPRHQAVRARSLAVVQVLLDHGANPNAADQRGSTPLHRASSSTGAGGTAGIDPAPFVELLLARGADPKRRMSITSQKQGKELSERTVKRPVAKKKATPTEMPVVSFAETEEWSAWLASRHPSSMGVWVKIAKKESGQASITYAEALDVALAWGWIDGQKGKFDEAWWLQKFTPRGPRSMWSKINREKAIALIAAGKMMPSGLAEVERAKKDGRWDRAYESQSRATVPEDLEMALARNPRAKKFFATLDSRNRYAVLFRVQHAKKAETRARRIAQFVEMLAKGEKLHP